MASQLQRENRVSSPQTVESHLSSLLAARVRVQTRLDELAEERHRVEQEKLSLEEQYKEAVLSDAQRLCQNFAWKFTNKLPLELRDMVYSQVWSVDSLHDDDIQLDALDSMRSESDINRDLKETAPWLLSCKGDSCQCFFWWDFPIWVQPAFVGQQVAKEAAAAYYRTMPMCMKQLDVRNMESFMLHDDFHLGIRPADHLRQLHFWIEATEKNDLGSWWDGYIYRERLPDLENYMRPLLEIRLKKDFRLVIRWSDLDMASGYRLEALRPIVRPLRDAGAHVQVLSSVYGMRDSDVSDFYELSLLEWQSKWQHAAFVEQIERAEGGTSATSSESEEEFSNLEDEETESLQSSDSAHESEVSNESSSSDHLSVNVDETMTMEITADPVIYMLAQRARADPALKDLMKVVATGKASREQLQTFQEHTEELAAEVEAERSS